MDNNFKNKHIIKEIKNIGKRLARSFPGKEKAVNSHINSLFDK